MQITFIKDSILVHEDDDARIVSVINIFFAKSYTYNLLVSTLWGDSPSNRSIIIVLICLKLIL